MQVLVGRGASTQMVRMSEPLEEDQLVYWSKAKFKRASPWGEGSGAAKSQPPREWHYRKAYGRPQTGSSYTWQ